MIPRPDRSLATVRCEECPGRPVLPTHWEEVRTGLCVRCQEEKRPLPLPHPPDHLCKVCRRECPNCGALTTAGGRCRACQGTCRTCSTPLPERPAPADELVQVKPEGRKDRRRKWTRTYYPRSWGRSQCASCAAKDAADPVRTVLAALPERLVHACGGAVPPAALQTIRSELTRRTPAQLIARVERRWWASWAHRRLERKPGESGQESWRPDDVVVWLLAPTPCPEQCEDGRHLAPPEHPDRDDTPCTACKGGLLLRVHGGHDEDERSTEEPAVSTAADRGLAEALAYRPPVRECVGKDGACGVPVAEPYTRCPACSGWPWCACGRRRYNPERANSCTVCAATG